MRESYDTYHIFSLIGQHAELEPILNAISGWLESHIPDALVTIMGEFKHEVRQFQKPYDNQQAEQISLMV